MKKALIVFESKFGQTEKIAEFAQNVANRRGFETTLLRVKAARDVSVARYDAVIVVAPIYFGRHPRAVEQFLSANRDGLDSVAAAFVSVSNSAASADAAVRANAVWVAKTFVAAVGLHPSAVLTTGGALPYRDYSVLLRLVMKLIARRSGAPTDTARNHELTDWSSLDADLSRFITRSVCAPSVDDSGVYERSGASAIAAHR